MVNVSYQMALSQLIYSFLLHFFLQGLEDFGANVPSKFLIIPFKYLSGVINLLKFFKKNLRRFYRPCTEKTVYTIAYMFSPFRRLRG